MENLGFLPTQVSEQAKAMGKAKPVTVELTGDGMTVLSGKAKQDARPPRGPQRSVRTALVHATVRKRGTQAAEWVVQAHGRHDPYGHKRCPEWRHGHENSHNWHNLWTRHGHTQRQNTVPL